MDQLLKARKLSSASARRKRVQVREQEETEAQERYIEHKRRIMLYDHLAEQASPTESESNNDSDVSRHERDDSVTTPSECSVVTPNDTPSAPSAFESTSKDMIKTVSVPEKPQLQLVLPDSLLEAPEASMLEASPAPKLQASLVARSDFTYDRFSMIFDPPKIQTSPAETVSTPELEYDDDYSPSPVEIATPISISLPKTRPSVISISSRSNKKRRTISSQSPLAQESRPQSPQPPPPPPRSARRLSASSARSGFLASEAQPMSVPELPRNASSLIASARRDSIAISLNGETQRPMQRKSSQPILSAIKTGHGRMNSIKSLIKTPTHTSSPSVSSSRPESRSSRPPNSAADIMNDSFQAFETVPADLYDPPATPCYRPRTSYHPSRPSTSSSSSRQPSVTALPTLPSLNGGKSIDEAAETHPGLMRRKKSFSSLRKHSESIGQAFKFVASKSKGTAGHTPKLSQHSMSQQHDVPMPPVPQPPTLMAPTRSQTVEISSFLTPPPPSPSPSISARSMRSRKSVASYSMFPPSPQVRHEVKGSVGLGLGLRV